jgi:hypothetical protein
LGTHFARRLSPINSSESDAGLSRRPNSQGLEMNSMHAACLEELFVVFEGHDSATLHTYPPASADPSAKRERYLVSGPHRLFRFGTERKTANFGTWRFQKEGEGFYFDPLDLEF